MNSTLSNRMPVVFIGHGNPMNAIQQNQFTEMLTNLGQKIPKPKAIVCISAHWMTEGTWVTHMENPRTIHDFYGFPKEISAVQYLAPGNAKLAEEICARIPRVQLDDQLWGLDHGTWSVLRHMYPKADIPVVQLSLYMQQPATYHFELGQQLRFLRDEGVLILGSGNIVHNLQTMSWDANAKPMDWAIEFDQWVKTQIQSRDYTSLIHQATTSRAGKLSIPSPDHWYPLLYVLGASDEKDELHFEYEGIENSSISMRAVGYGVTVVKIIQKN